MKGPNTVLIYPWYSHSFINIYTIYCDYILSPLPNSSHFATRPPACSFKTEQQQQKPPKKITESDLPVTVLNIKMMSSQLYFLSFTDSSGCAFNLDTHFSLLMLSTLFISELMLQSTLCINNFLASKFLSLDLIWKFWQTERGIPKNCIEESGFCHQTPAFKFNKELAPQNLTTHSHCLSKVSSSF